MVGVSHSKPGFAIVRRKHGRTCVLAKVVVAHPTGEIVVAMPVKSRRFATPSLPAEALQLARRAGATAWVVRFDHQRRCYRLRLDQAELVGEWRADGELYVPLNHFAPTPWLEWDYVTTKILL